MPSEERRFYSIHQLHCPQFHKTASYTHSYKSKLLDFTTNADYYGRRSCRNWTEKHKDKKVNKH